MASARVARGDGMLALLHPRSLVEEMGVKIDSVALMDDICPPSTVFAAYNHYAGPKEIRIWPYNQHEGGQSFQAVEQVRFLAQT